MLIKPIETIYNGYRFRSRLEARWAVFFDAAGIKYQYEPEGFDLDAEYYLPDFYLPEFYLYIEIKPLNREIFHHVGDGNEWEKKCSKFRDLTGNAILLCYGDPYEMIYHRLFAYDHADSSGGDSEFDCVFTEHDDKPVLVAYSDMKDLSVCINENMLTSNRIGTSYEFSRDLYLLWDKATSKENYVGGNIISLARLKARQARFEHVECG